MVRRNAVVSRVRGRTDWLLEAGLLTSEALANSVSVAEQSGQPLRQVLDRLGLVSQQAWADASARATGLKRIDADDFPDVLADDERLSPHYLRRHGLALLSRDGEQPRIAIADPTDMHVRQALSIIFGREIDYVVATERDIETALTHSEAGIDVAVTYDHATRLYAIALTTPQGWPAAPTFSMRFDGPKPNTISTLRHQVSDTTLTVTDTGFSNVLNGLQYNQPATAFTSPAAVAVSLSAAAEPVAQFKDCTQTPLA